ncbi:MAG: nucleoside kinase [Oscillospiraceae bacterium]|nr:nucleoside kinase [Oscillospiraceae bacterium]
MRQIIPKKYTPLPIKEIITMAKNDPHELVRSSEAYYNQQVMSAAHKIAINPDYTFVLLCGPSASGKTTTAHKLKHRLMGYGAGARVVSMDDFFMGIEFYPKLPDGEPDMESFECIDHDLLNKCFEELFETGESDFPIFDFANQKRSERKHHMKLDKKDILIMEGIHALNPEILSNIPQRKIFRIYVSVRTKFIDREKTILVPKDIRLTRRIVRDYNFRNYSPTQTLNSWVNVVAAERINIDRYRDDVDLKIDNTIDYEVCIWHRLLKGLLDSIQEGDYDEHPQVERIFEALTHFPEIDYNLIPKNSLLREFIGKDI